MPADPAQSASPPAARLERGATGAVLRLSGAWRLSTLPAIQTGAGRAQLPAGRFPRRRRSSPTSTTASALALLNHLQTAGIDVQRLPLAGFAANDARIVEQVRQRLEEVNDADAAPTRETARARRPRDAGRLRPAVRPPQFPRRGAGAARALAARAGDDPAARTDRAVRAGLPERDPGRRAGDAADRHRRSPTCSACRPKSTAPTSSSSTVSASARRASSHRSSSRSSSPAARARRSPRSSARCG